MHDLVTILSGNGMWVMIIAVGSNFAKRNCAATKNCVRGKWNISRR